MNTMTYFEQLGHAMRAEHNAKPEVLNFIKPELLPVMALKCYIYNRTIPATTTTGTPSNYRAIEQIMKAHACYSEILNNPDLAVIRELLQKIDGYRADIICYYELIKALRELDEDGPRVQSILKDKALLSELYTPEKMPSKAAPAELVARLNSAGEAITGEMPDVIKKYHALLDMIKSKLSVNYMFAYLDTVAGVVNPQRELHSTAVIHVYAAQVKAAFDKMSSNAGAGENSTMQNSTHSGITA